MKHLRSLEQLGLNYNEQKVYLTALQLEKATANQIAHQANLKRPTTYDVLYRLQSRNFLYETTENKKRYFMANHPNKLLEIIESQKRSLEADMPALTSILNTLPKKPKVAYFEGIDGITQLYEDTLKSLERGDEILAYVTEDTINYLEDYAADYVARRSERGVKLRGIYQKSKKLNKYLDNNKSQLRSTRLADPKKFFLKNEINIYADKMIIITYHPEPYGVLIESKEVIDTQRAIFEMAWQGLK